MAKYGPKAQKEVKQAVHQYKEGELTSARSNKKVTSQKQAVAIGLSKARQKGGKTPSQSKNS